MVQRHVPTFVERSNNYPPPKKREARMQNKLLPSSLTHFMCGQDDRKNGSKPVVELIGTKRIVVRGSLDTCVSMYADDIAVWSQHKDKLNTQYAVQKAVVTFGLWSAEHKLSLNPAKCEVAFLSTDKSEAK